MSSRREEETNTTSAHLARRGALSTAERPPVHFFDASLDGLFTYCLSVMCEHDAAVTALGEALAVAERQRSRDRAPADTALHRPWLYALARWSCLRRLSAATGRPEPPRLTGPDATRRRRELVSLAWPEAAGTTPEQREALELAVRHQLPVHEVAAVLNLSGEAARMQLSSAACEVERTRAALAVVDSGGCRAVAGLARDHEVLLGTALRRELVRHVDECGECRLAAERAMASQPWPGTAALGTGTLAVVEAPRPRINHAMATALRARLLHTPRFNRRGFPVELKDRHARRERIRSRAITTTVVATVVAAPVLALWAAYRGAPLAGEGREAPVSATEAEDRDGVHTHPYENAGRAGRTEVPGGTRHGAARDVAIGVEAHESDQGGKGAPGDGSVPSTAPGGHSGAGENAGDRGGPRSPHAGRLTVTAEPTGDATLITLAASGGTPVEWSAYSDAGWLRLSQSSGMLHPGESVTIRVTVDRDREPAGAWSARIHIAPAQTVITVQGQGQSKGPDAGPSDPGPSDPDPSPSDPDPNRGPSDPEPSPT